MYKNYPGCEVEVGTHIGPNWRDKISGLVVCSRHKLQYDERDDLGDYDWEILPICIKCGKIDSPHWWKCCEDHCPSDEPDVVCNSCRLELHPAPKPPKGKK